MLPDALHRLDLPVALLAGDAGGDVGTVVEGDEVGDLVDAHPPDRLRLDRGIAFAQVVEAERPVERSSGETTGRGFRSSAIAAFSSATTAARVAVTALWQFMQTPAGGMPACRPRSAAV